MQVTGKGCSIRDCNGGWVVVVGEGRLWTTCEVRTPSASSFSASVVSGW